MNEKPLVNRVASSGLITLNLENDYPNEAIFEAIDLKGFLFKELILKEKDFRESLKEIDWEKYSGKVVLLFCSNDAIVPVWSYMLMSSYLKPIARDIFFGTKEEYLNIHYRNILKGRDYSEFEGKRVVIKGCSDKDVPASAYITLTELLQPFAQSIMYGEPCSTVPIFKRPRKV